MDSGWPARERACTRRPTTFGMDSHKAGRTTAGRQGHRASPGAAPDRGRVQAVRSSTITQQPAQGVGSFSRRWFMAEKASDEQREAVLQKVQVLLLEGKATELTPAQRQQVL